MICSAEIFRASGVKSTLRFRTELRKASMSVNRNILGAIIGASGTLFIQNLFWKSLRRRAISRPQWDLIRNLLGMSASRRKKDRTSRGSKNSGRKFNFA